jgi:hypothetical protein
LGTAFATPRGTVQSAYGTAIGLFFGPVDAKEGQVPNQIFNTIGLLLNMIGVGLLFFYGPPQPSLEEGVGLSLQDATVLDNGKTVAQHDKEVRELRNQHQVLSRLALILIFLGFALQLIATWVLNS